MVTGTRVSEGSTDGDGASVVSGGDVLVAVEDGNAVDVAGIDALGVGSLLGVALGAEGTARVG
jgi:hypothetical protein